MTNFAKMLYCSNHEPIFPVKWTAIMGTALADLRLKKFPRGGGGDIRVNMAHVVIVALIMKCGN